MSLLGKAAWLKARQEMSHCRAALADVERAQQRVLVGLLGQNRDTVCGRRWGFGSIRTGREYAERVPLATYADLAPDIAQARARRRVLSRDPIVQWVYTSGACSAPKLLPHTDASIRDWCRGHARSVYACATELRTADRLFSGEAIYDVASASTGYIDGVPAGYISGVASQRNRRMRRFQNVPASITDLPRHEEKLVALTKWSVGRNITVAAGITSFVYRLLLFIRDNAASVLRGDPLLGPAVAAACDGAGRVDLHRLWPHFDLVLSTGVPVDLYLPLLKTVAPRATVRDTYAASEGAFGFSVGAERGLILNSDLYYFELADPQTGDGAVPLHEAVAGEAYELVVSTSNGLWRYRTGDVVQILGLHPARVAVLGRRGSTINLSGEKLLEQQVTSALLGASRPAGLACSDYFFFGWIAPDCLTYCLALEPDRPLGDDREFMERFACLLERENDLFRLVGERTRREMHLVRLERGTMARLTEAAETARGTAGHVKLRRLTTLDAFCSLVSPDQIARQTLDPAVHVTHRLLAGGEALLAHS